MIARLKKEDFKTLGTFALSDKWRDALIANSKVNKMLDTYFEDEVTKVNGFVCKHLKEMTNMQKNLMNLEEKSIEQVQRKCNEEILDNALTIYEDERKKRHESIAFDEDSVRKARHQWKKLWKSMRSYVG